MKFILIWLGFLIIDLILVRDLNWVYEFGLGKRFLVNFLLTALGFLIVLYFLRGINKKWQKRAALITVILPLLLQSSNFAIYKKFISPFGISFFNENPLYTLKLWFENINFLETFLIIIISLILLPSLFNLPKIKNKILFYINALLLVIILFASWFSWYSIGLYQYSLIAFYGNGVNILKNFQYQSLAINKVKVPKMKAKKDLANIIWIVGESMNFNRMSLYGYKRDTTPNLVKIEQEKKLIKFNNVTSIGNKTRSSVPYLFKGLQGIDITGVIYQYPSVFDYAKSLGYKTAIISAQDWKWGELDQMFVDENVDWFQHGSDFSADVSVSRGADDLKVFEKAIKPYIKNQTQPYLLIVQMAGSHYPYTLHSPKEFKKFLPEKSKNDDNAYDNTVVYSDIYLSKLINESYKHDQNTWIFFAPDHGQSLDKSKGLFNEGYDKSVIHTPMFIIAPDKIDDKKLNSLKSNINSPISQADVLATILDIFAIKAIKPLDGISIFKTINKDRLRIVSANMITLHNDPNAALVLPDFSYYWIDFSKKSVILPDAKTVIKYEDFKYKNIFDKRL